MNNNPPDMNALPDALDEAVKKVLYFSEHNTPPARRAHPADRVTDNIETVFRPAWKRVKEAASFTEAQQ